ncbi:MAG: hypothetical protein M3Y41_19770 [Pseudomonadota bacterium]|nr:hypothetical protein [Pseudomonadota bacterium]
MPLRITSASLVSAPARIGLAVVAGFAALLAILFAVRPDMMMSLVHEVMGTM